MRSAAWLVGAAVAAWVAGGCGSSDDTGSGSGGAGGASGAAGAAGIAGAAGSDAGGAAGALAFCDGATSLIYDPTAHNIDAFPDDFFTVDDSTSATGVRVHTKAGENLDVPASAKSFAGVFDDLSTLDGFGTTAAEYLQFTAALDPATLPPSGDGSGKASDSVLLVKLGDAPELVPFQWEQVPEKQGDAHTTLVIDPMLPLAPEARYGLVVTNAAKDASGGCIAPSPIMKSLLDGSASAPALARLAPRYVDLMKALSTLGAVERADQISAAVVFTTEHTVDDSMAIAKDIRTRTPAYTAAGACTDPGGSYLVCEGTFPAGDYRKNRRGIVDGDPTPQDHYTLPVTTYLPKTKPASGQFPTIIFGHGLNGDRHQAAALADLAAPEGYATVAIDAVKHGDHPDHATLNAAIDFFGISLANGVDAIKLRDNWRQSTYDKLQLLEMLRPGVDIDGDSQPDVGIDKLVYLGVSLGGIMSAEFLALAPEVQVGIPIVPGARVVDIIKDGQQFSAVINVLRGSNTDGAIARFFPIVQSIVDRGDAGAYTQHIVTDRLPGFDAKKPQVLMQMVINDDTVPNSTNLFFARGLGVPHVGDELLHTGTIPHEQALPVSANLDATHTGGMFQFDVLSDGTSQAKHSNIAADPVAIDQSFHFLSTYYKNGVSEILDPYRDLKIKP